MRLRYSAAALLAAGLVVLLISACSTAPSSRGGKDADSLVESINAAPVEALVEQSSVPMFFDGELIVRVSDVELLWSGLRDAGFVIQPLEYSVEPASAEDYRLVADTFDMESFFGNGAMVPEDAKWLVAETSLGMVRLLFADGPDRKPLIIGIARSSNE